MSASLLAAFFVSVPAAKAEGGCTLPPGKEDFEKRVVVLPGGAELTLAWIGKGTMAIGEEGELKSEKDLEAEIEEARERARWLAKFRELAELREDAAPVPEQNIPDNLVRLSVDGFWIGVCEVTQGQWESVMGNNPSYFRGEELPVASQRATLPVECVSWDDCLEFCRRTGLRLPTEMEWQLACKSAWRYGTWSWTSKNSGNRTHPAGRSNAGSPGLFDMDGNVCEWCADWFAPWPEASAANYAGPAAGTERVLCGGSWCGDDWFAIRFRKERLSLPPACRYNNVGFRVCLTPAPDG